MSQAPSSLQSSATSLQSVCWIRLSALGDCINAFGVMGAIKRNYPDLKQLWLIDQRFAPLFTDEQGHELIPMLRLDFKDKGIWAVKDVKSLLRSQNIEHFDALLNMQTSIKSSLSSIFIKSDHKYGYDKARSRELQSWFVDRKIEPAADPHVLSGFMQFPRQLGLQIDQPVWDFALDPYLIDNALSNLGRENRICAISPCSAKAVKNWTNEGYIEVIRHAQSKGMDVILLGGRSEFELNTCEFLTAQCPNVLNLCGKTDLRELAAYLKCSKVLIAPDSGSMHLASALNTPTIGLFAVHNDQRVGPWNFMEFNVSVYHELAQKELQQGSGNIPWRYRIKELQAMQHITPDMVLSTFDKVAERYKF